MIDATGHISGAHLKPAVTPAFATTGYFPLALVPAGLAAQFAGALAASAALRLRFGDVANPGSTLPTGGAGRSFGLEIVLTCLLMCVIVSVATGTRAVAGGAGERRHRGARSAVRRADQRRSDEPRALPGRSVR